MDTKRSNSLYRWALRSHRTGIIAWGAGLAISITVTAAAYPVAAKAAGQTVAEMGRVAQTIGGSLAFLTGPLDRLDTIAGYVSYKVFPMTTVLLAIYAALMGAQVLRGAEAKGLFDLWFATGHTRAAIARDRILAFLTALSVILVCIYIGTVLGGVATGESMVSGAVGQCFAVGLVALFAFALSFLLSQFFVTTRTPSAITSAFLVATYFLANIYQSLGPLRFLHVLSPFYWYLQMRTLIPGHQFDAVAMLVLLMTSLIMVAAGLRLSLSRDATGVTISAVERTHPPDYAFRPSRLARRTLWMNWIAEQPVALISWCLGIGLFAFVEAGLVPSALRLISQVQGPLRKLIASSGGVASPDTYLSLLMTFSALLVAGFTVFQVARWAGDATAQRNDAIFTHPVSMVGFVASRMLSMILLVACVSLAAIAGTWAGSAAGGYSIHWDGLARVFGDTVLFGFGVGGLGLLLVTAFRSGTATGVFGGFLVLSYFLDLLVSLFSWPSWVLRASVFHSFNAGLDAPYLAVPALADILLLAIMGIVGATAALELLRRGIRVTA